MVAIPEIIKSRHRRYGREQRSLASRLSRIALGLGILVSLIISFLIIALTITFANLTQNLPSPEILPLLLDPPNGDLLQPTRLFDRSGEHIIAVLENQNSTNRKYLTLQEDHPRHISPSLIMATIAIADPNFWTHQGCTWDGFQEDNHPTLAQRLVSENLLWTEPPSLQRTLKERFLAAQITSLFGHEKILEWYLNSTGYGQLAYGADAAARTYFGKSATTLSLAEAAILAAAAESPALNPIDAPQAALQAKDRVLLEMFTQELISTDQLQVALEEELTFQPLGDLSVNIAPAFTDLVLDQVSEFLPMGRVQRGGLNIVTTLDYDLQTQTECTTAVQLARITDSSLPMEGCEMARLLPSLQQKSNLPDSEIASSVVVLNPNSGQILALVGGDKPGLDPTHLPGRQPGSILTPFIYLTSFTRGMNPATQTWDIPASLEEGLSDIQNPDGIYHGPVRLRTALVNDYIIPAIQILTQMGPDQVWHTTQQLGMRNLQIPPGEGAYRLPLQGGEVTLLEISQAYGVFAAQGILAGVGQDSISTENGNSPINPQVLLKVVDNSGEEWLDCSGQITECRSIKRPVTSPQLAYLVTNILSDETARWPSLGHPNPLEIGRPVGAKIGSTITGEDTWTVGYTPDLVIAVWIGIEEPGQEAGISPAWTAGLWHSITQYATRDLPAEEFIPPPGITELQVCDPSGLLPTDECPHIVSEVFIDGNEPTQTDTLFQSFLINRETGRQATIFTPPALVDEEVYMVVPPEAELWAREANIPSLPEAYDVLDETTSLSNGARITSPSMFNTISGSVPVIGHASGEGFDFYRLQIGSGLNPDTWLQIGEDVHQPVHNGQLGVWKTEGLSGLYALQLIIAHEDDTVESSTIQVTIDNQKPQVHIRYPQDGQKFTLSETEAITIQADVSDDLELAKVEYFIDGDLVTELTSPPYAIPWKIKIGKHILRVRAFDKAGNVSEESMTIIVER